MGHHSPQGGPDVGRGRLGLDFRIAPCGYAGVVPLPQRHTQLAFQGKHLLVEAGKLAFRVLVLSFATPAAAESDSAGRELLTSGPEPVNVVGLGLALAVLFLFRRFSKTS